jgi:hypothetical protein
LDLGLDVVDGIGGLDLKSDGLAGEGLNEDLHDVLWLCCGGVIRKEASEGKPLIEQWSGV